MLFLINNKEQAWIPRRAAHKRLFPACLDASVGGHVAAGESYQEAFERELQEELNLDDSLVPYKLVGKLTPLAYNLSAYMHVYLVYTNEEPDYNRADFMEAQWREVPELLDAIKHGEQTKGDLANLISFLHTILLRPCFHAE